MNGEMRTHLEYEVEDRIRRGMTPLDARRSAHADFGGVERFKEEARSARGVRPVEDLLQDARYALRVLQQSSVFTRTTILTPGVPESRSGSVAVRMVSDTRALSSMAVTPNFF